MALFGKKEKQGEVQQELDMLVTTTENIGRPYDILGLVTVTLTQKKLDTHCDANLIAIELAKKAVEKGADAIISFRYETCINSVNFIDEIGYGTAVKFK